MVFVPADVLEHYVYENVEVIRGPPPLVKSVVKRFDPDVLALHAPTIPMLKTALSTGLPVVVWIHGAEVLYRALHNYIPPFGVKNNLVRIKALVEDLVRNMRLREILRQVNAVVYVSKWMREMAEKYLLFSHPNSFIIPNPVDTELFRIIIPIKNRPKECISVRAMEWKYGLDIAIIAFSKMPYKLKIVGKGSLEGYLRALARKYDSNVEFDTAGVPHEELPYVYNKYSLFIAPSRTEAQGVAMCEAMACGTPAVATRVGGIPEFVIDGFNGVLVEPENPLEIRRAVQKLLSDDALLEELSLNARRFVEEKLSHRIIIPEELSVLKEAANY